MNESLVTALPLENGLTLELLDESRVLAGDRWLVHLVARMEIPLDSGLLDGVPEADRLLGILKEVHGDRLEYRADLKKPFVDENERDGVFQGFREIVLREKRPYLAHPDFAKRCALSRISELERRDPLRWGSASP